MISGASELSDFVDTRHVRVTLKRFATGFALLVLPGCTTLPSSGPSTGSVRNMSSSSVGEGAVQVVDVSVDAARKVAEASPPTSFFESVGDGRIVGALVGNGDSLEISVWEAPTPVLFGLPSGTTDGRSTGAGGVARSNQLPEQIVDTSGMITVPFVGKVQAAGKTTDAIAADIRARLIGKAHDPQVIVRLSRNATSNVTVVGEVANSLRMPLTAKGERLLDALASAGGVKQPVGKMTIQVTRGEEVAAMPLDAVIKDPRQNIRLQADDVITLLFQPYSFTVLGAAKANQEIPFEGTGFTLSQALGRMGGLDDQRASPKGVFIFRFEDPKVFAASASPVATTKDGKVPVIYKVNMRDPATLFVAQTFPIRDKDVIYISNAPLADFSKFLQAVSQIIYPIAVIQSTNIF